MRRTLILLPTLMLVGSMLIGCTPTPASVDVPITLKGSTASSLDMSLPQTKFKAGVPYHFVIKNESAIALDWGILMLGAHTVNLSKDTVFRIDASKLQPNATADGTYTFSTPGTAGFIYYGPANDPGPSGITISIEK
jgi:hypothetical protein